MLKSVFAIAAVVALVGASYFTTTLPSVAAGPCNPAVQVCL